MEVIDFSDLHGVQQIFSWQTEGSGEVLHIATKLLNEYLEVTNFPTTLVLLTDHLVEAATRNGIEAVRLQQLTDAHLAMPLQLLQHREGWHIIADGNHRLLKLRERGHENFRAWLVPESIWSSFIVKNMPHPLGALRPGFQNQGGCK